MTCAAQIAPVVEERLISTVLLDIDLSRDDVINVSAAAIAIADDSDLAERIAAENVRPRSVAPLRRVVVPAESALSLASVSIAILVLVNIRTCYRRAVRQVRRFPSREILRHRDSSIRCTCDAGRTCRRCRWE